MPATATDGYIYVWVSNESENTKVWFDDLRVTHTQTIVTQATDHGVWGDVLRELKAAEFTYRFGYQGKFAEKDEETGWNHFELREYDPIIGRWLIPDPYRQYWSPYLAMGNNPINKVDPDGGCDDCPPYLPNGSQELWNESLRLSEQVQTGGGPNTTFKVLHLANDSFGWDWFLEMTVKGNVTTQTAVILIYNTNKKDLWTSKYGQLIEKIGKTRVITTDDQGNTLTRDVRYRETDLMKEWIRGAQDYHCGGCISAPTVWDMYRDFMLSPTEQRKKRPTGNGVHR